MINSRAFTDMSLCACVRVRSRSWMSYTYERLLNVYTRTLFFFVGFLFDKQLSHLQFIKIKFACCFKDSIFCPQWACCVFFSVVNFSSTSHETSKNEVSYYTAYGSGGVRLHRLDATIMIVTRNEANAQRYRVMCEYKRKNMIVLHGRNSNEERAKREEEREGVNHRRKWNSVNRQDEKRAIFIIFYEASIEKAIMCMCACAYVCMHVL